MGLGKWFICQSKPKLPWGPFSALVPGVVMQCVDKQNNSPIENESTLRLYKSTLRNAHAHVSNARDIVKAIVQK